MKHRCLVRLVAMLVFAAYASNIQPLMAIDALTRSEACKIIDNDPSAPITGLWRFGVDGAELAIIPQRGSDVRFDVFLLNSPDYSILPGQKIASLSSTSAPGTYDATFPSSLNPLKGSKRCIIRVENEGRLSITPYKRGTSVRLWRWLPYLFRFSVSKTDTRPPSADGAVRLYPPSFAHKITVL